MRVALCISGQPRRALDTFQAIYDNIIQPNNADVFIHMNYDKNDSYIEKSHMDNGSCILPENIDEQLISLYKPIRYLVETPKNFQKPTLQITEKRLQNTLTNNSHKNWSESECKLHIEKQLTSTFYSIYKCNELKETYANENGIVYDYVIRVRFDFLPMQPIICSSLDPDYIYYVAMGQPDELISDWFNIGSNAIMNIYSSLYLNIEYLNTFKFYSKAMRKPNTIEPSNDCGGLYEFMVRDLMDLYKIPKRGFSFNCELIK
jgi:hypothetical protein